MHCGRLLLILALGLLDVISAQLAHELPVADVCAVAPGPGRDQFLVAGAAGSVLAVSSPSGQVQHMAKLPELLWDNHFSSASPLTHE